MSGGETSSAGPLSAKELLSVSPKHQERFWRYVDKRGPDECWPWIGGASKLPHSNYGFMRIGTLMFKAHRISFVIHHHGLSKGVSVLHSCDNPPCVNPAHLSAGTVQDNFRDMIAKKRDGICGDRNYQRRHPEKIRRGEAASMAKLNADQVREIRAMYASGEWWQREIAEKFGVTQILISKIVARKVWGHVP